VKTYHGDVKLKRLLHSHRNCQLLVTHWSFTFSTMCHRSFICISWWTLWAVHKIDHINDMYRCARCVQLQSAIYSLSMSWKRAVHVISTWQRLSGGHVRALWRNQPNLPLPSIFNTHRSSLVSSNVSKKF